MEFYPRGAPRVDRAKRRLGRSSWMRALGRARVDERYPRVITCGFKLV
ncbi:unnamed product [Ostreococcus tauri]|uniref:Unnamed product n=1 Tax=Ostreococcus tauri TaxID=70448 RepID=A0A098E5L7_OSTTA|nr:unnamed product [Ostreococcus tauri]CEG00702.1 unnamed product [Ostreococcus tauri]|eukprot:XP_022840531.1 unnamed product [Ostreococcus tauri]